MLKVRDVFTTITNDFPTVAPSADFEEIFTSFQNMNPLFRSIFVIDIDCRLKGTIPVSKMIKGFSLKKGIRTRHSYSVKSLFQLTSSHMTAEDLMVKCPIIYQDDSLEEALQFMVENNVDELPVLDENKRIAGHLNIFELLQNFD
ncbi:CBS domain-containing protein [Salipaludibacillus aurantiacus]|uniref:CBS domain-containing protein n=1 Tax=Salipaludibacillus aurantiacus TaxID=1601833 RepID=A0A1H9RT20_9BACI|nr:CBS domain-containing protein [Salipaludibacillus aurantiacus]SER75990.1 CBS domain-containing protein [Salipaludibacillus aurantiacus]